MSKQMGLLEFFSMEASEYLERLDALLSRQPDPDAGEFVRLSRALRGSALMAKQQGFAGAAAALENLARAVSEGRRAWDEQTRQLAISSVETFKTFLRSIAEWSADDAAKADALATELDRAAGRSSAVHRAPVDPSVDAGTRAFVGREAASVAAGMDAAAKALQQAPTNLDPVRRAVSQMQSLRGVAGLRDLDPLPDLLEGVELAAAELERRRGNAADGALVLYAAAKALARTAQEITTDGQADGDAPEVQEFATRLRRLLGMDAGVVAIEQLYHDDDGPHVVHEGVRTSRPGGLDPVELVAHGEHLEQAAEELERATTTAQRELRATAVLGTLRALAEAGGDLFHDTVAHFANVVRDAIARGMATQEARPFAAALRRAAELLRVEGDPDERTGALRTIMQPLIVFAGSRATAASSEPTPVPAAPAEPTPEAAAPSEPEPASALPEQEPPVLPGAPFRRPRAISAPTIPAPGVLRQTDPHRFGMTADRRAMPMMAATDPKPPAPPKPKEPPTIAGGWLRYERYAGTLGLEGGSLDEMLAGPPVDPLAEASPIVPITDLQYDARAALLRAQELRGRIAQSMAVGGSTDDVRDLIEEVLDLVALAGVAV